MPFGIDDALAGLGLVTSLFGGGKSDPNADAIREDNARKRQLFQLAMDYWNKLNAGGQYDPTRRLDFLDTRINANRHREISDLAGANTIMGYRPGDTPAQQNIENVDRAYRYQHQQLANDIMDTVPRTGLQDLLTVNSSYPSYQNVPQADPRFGAGQLQNAGGFLDRLLHGFKDPTKPSAPQARQPIQTKINASYGSVGGFRSPLDRYLR